MSQSVLSHQIDKNICEAFDCDREATTQIIVNVGTLGNLDLNLCKNCVSKFDSNENKKEKLSDSTRITSRIDCNDIIRETK